jgi:small-conductance mechanosensitive channel
MSEPKSHQSGDTFIEKVKNKYVLESFLLVFGLFLLGYLAFFNEPIINVEILSFLYFNIDLLSITHHISAGEASLFLFFLFVLFSLGYDLNKVLKKKRMLWFLSIPIVLAVWGFLTENSQFFSLLGILVIYFIFVSYLNFKRRIKKSVAIWSYLPDMFVVTVLGFMIVNEVSSLSLPESKSNFTISLFIFVYFGLAHCLDPVLKYLFYKFTKNREKEEEEIKKTYPNDLVKKTRNSMFLKQKFKYLTGGVEEIDKDLALLLVSMFFWLAISVEYHPKYIIDYTDKNNIVLETSRSTSERMVVSALQPLIKATEGERKITLEQKFIKAKGDPHRYYFALFSLSAALFILSLIKYNFRFEREEIEPEKANSDNLHGRYNQGYTCQESLYDKTIALEPPTDEAKHPAYYKKLSSAYYEKFRSAYIECKEGDWMNYLNLANNVPKNINNYKELIDVRALNDLSVIEMGKEKLKLQHVKNLIIAAETLPSAIYNLCIFLIKNKEDPSIKDKNIIKESGLESLAESENIDDIIEHYILKGENRGHTACHNLKIKWTNNNKSAIDKLEYEKIADYFSADVLTYSERFQRPVEVLISATRGIVSILAFYMIMVAFKHPQSAAIGTGLGIFGIFGFGIGFMFKPSIQSFMAGIRIYLDDFARIGDRVESKELKIDGRVEKFTLTNVKIKNFDNSVNNLTLIEFLGATVCNWRLLSKTEGRRIRRTLLIDIKSIKKYEKYREKNEFFEQILNLPSMEEFKECKKASFEQTYESDVKMKGECGIDLGIECKDTLYPDCRFVTNLGLFRAYVWGYLHDHSFIDSNQPIIISQKEATAEGLPIEVYAFTMPSSEFTDYKSFNNLQSDIFEHLISVTEFFKLELFQYSTDNYDGAKASK